MHKVTDAGIGDAVGTVVISPGQKGLSFKVDVTGLAPGQHGFHLHENGSCAPGAKDGKTQAGLAAGAHFDPGQTKSHKGPTGAGHMGDLPVLVATDKGVNSVVTVGRLAMADVAGRSLVIHEGGDNFTDTPENGGGKGRIVCGIIPKE
jgi:Cu-Zn family superoxide dismutase